MHPEDAPAPNTLPLRTRFRIFLAEAEGFIAGAGINSASGEEGKKRCAQVLNEAGQIESN